MVVNKVRWTPLKTTAAVVNFILLSSLQALTRTALGRVAIAGVRLQHGCDTGQSDQFFDAQRKAPRLAGKA
jgi:hypothetical protein